MAKYCSEHPEKERLDCESYCGQCGEELITIPEPHCTCGISILEGDKFCWYCGNQHESLKEKSPLETSSNP